jgi:sarcosine oxidase
VMGSAAAHALATSAGRAIAGRQCRVALLEQHEFGHKHGSSHGHSRIIRPVYSQQHYAALMPEAYSRWAALEAEAGDKLYTQTGGLYWGPEGFLDQSGESSHSHRQTCDALGVEYEMVGPDEVARRWPPLVATPGWEGLFQPDCGILHADACVAALQGGAAAGGAELHERCVVTEIEGGQA